MPTALLAASTAALCACVTLPPTPAAGPIVSTPQPDPLWQKAVALADANRDWVAGLCKSKIEVYDQDGRYELGRELWMQSSLDAEGRVQTKLVRLLADGEDQTPEADEDSDGDVEEDEDEDAEEDEGLGDLDLWSMPFLPERQEELLVQRGDLVWHVDGRELVEMRFKPVETFSDADWGRAWLDRESGAPLLIEAVYEPSPILSPRIRSRLRFDLDESGAWRQMRELLEIDARFVILERRVRMDERCSAHFQKPATASAGEGR